LRPVVSTHRCHETSCIAVARHLHRVTSCRVSHAQTPNQTNPLHAIPCAAGWSKNPKVRATYQVLSPDHDHAARSPRMPVGTLDRVSPPPWSRHSHRARIERAFKARQLPYRRFRQLVRTVSTGQCCRWDAIEPHPCNPQAPRAAPATLSEPSGKTGLRARRPPCCPQGSRRMVRNAPPLRGRRFQRDEGNTCRRQSGRRLG